MKALGSILKWAGGTTALISLVIGSASVYELYASWSERKDAVGELVAASKLQLDSQDYEGGWLLLRQAFEIEPASEIARRFQVPYAMEWLRNIRVPEGKSFADLVDPLLPVLYRGASDARNSVAADVYAHIGWANHLKRRAGNETIEIDGHFRKALELDPENVYANLFWGHWTLNPQNRTDYGEVAILKARRHFDVALKSGKDRAFVVNLTLSALLASRDGAAERETLRYVNRFKKENLPITPGRIVKIARIFLPIASLDRKFAEAQVVKLSEDLPPSELRRIFDWTTGQLPPGRGLQRAARLYIAGRLAEAAGDKVEALAVYRSLAADESVGEAFLEKVVRPAIDRAGAGPR